MSSGNINDANRAAAECLRTLEKLLIQLEVLRINQQRIIELGGQPPASLTTAIETAKRVLVQLGVFLSDGNGQPHVGAPIINPQMAPILKAEEDMVKYFIGQIDEAKSALDQGREAPSTNESWGSRIPSEL